MKPVIPASLAAVLAAAAFAAPLGQVAAQDYPRKSVRMVVPYAAGCSWMSWKCGAKWSRR